MSELAHRYPPHVQAKDPQLCALLWVLRAYPWRCHVLPVHDGGDVREVVGGEEAGDLPGEGLRVEAYGPKCDGQEEDHRDASEQHQVDKVAASDRKLVFIVAETNCPGQ